MPRVLRAEVFNQALAAVLVVHGGVWTLIAVYVFDSRPASITGRSYSTLEWAVPL